MFIPHYIIELTSTRFFIMDDTDYWPFACEYSILNASVAVLQLLTADLDLQTLINANERVYTAFFNSDSAYHL